jgi:hypothetical protein
MTSRKKKSKSQAPDGVTLWDKIDAIFRATLSPSRKLTMLRSLLRKQVVVREVACIMKTIMAAEVRLANKHRRRMALCAEMRRKRSTRVQKFRKFIQARARPLQEKVARGEIPAHERDNELIAIARSFRREWVSYDGISDEALLSRIHRAMGMKT